MMVCMILLMMCWVWFYVWMFSSCNVLVILLKLGMMFLVDFVCMEFYMRLVFVCGLR